MKRIPMKNRAFHPSSFLLCVIFCIGGVFAPALPAARAQEGVAPTYTVWATREGLVGQRTANGHIIQPRDRFVALPSWKVLSSNGGNEFQVRVTYKDRTVVLPVWDVGPWNTHDDYWNPADRERYRDLPVGVPMAQAAVLQGYNGGLDEFGRTIRDPNGIDIADGAFWDDLGMTRTAKVQVTFLWLGRDPGPGNAQEAPRAPGPAAPAAPARPAAPAEAPPQVIAVPEGALAVDDGTAGYSASQAQWSSDRCGVGGKSSWLPSTTAGGANQASWAPSLPAPGFYEVMAYIPKCGKTPSTSTARYTVLHSKGATPVTLDQKAAAGKWASLGVYGFGASGDQRVTLGDAAGDSKRAVRFDAVIWVARSDSAPPDARVSKITPKNNGVTVTWGGTDDISGIASYDVQVRQLPNGIWRAWQTKTAGASGWFGPTEGKQFAFRARARDAAGNEQPWRDGEDMNTSQATP
jgi:hypothetical protein